MPVCGPKLSLCGLLLSIWGIVQLGLMGVFYWVKAVALAEDINTGDDIDWNLPDAAETFYSRVDAGYTQNAYNCWIAALMYLVTLAVSAHQFWANTRLSHTV